MTNEEIRGNLLAWIHDLETSDAKQGTGTLHRDGAFCCLGRAVLVLGGETVGDFLRLRGLPLGGYIDSVRDEVGLTAEEEAHCTRMNDGSLEYGVRRHTFPEIAAYLRAEILPSYSEKAAVLGSQEHDTK